MRLPPPPRAALAAAALALAGAPARAADAPTVPAPPGPAPAAAPAAAPAPLPGAETLERIEGAYDRLEKEAVRTVRRRRYEAILAYVRAAPRARDAEEAVAALVRLADEVELWDRALLHAEEYLAAWPSGKGEVTARFARARALGELGRTAEAKAAYEALTAYVSVARQGAPVVVAAWTRRAQFLAKAGDAEGAKQAWRGLKAAVGAAPDAGPVQRMADAEVRALDLTGRPARPFPADARDLEGRAVALGDYAGKVLLIDFWATWCGPCVQEMPLLVDSWRRWNPRGFEVLGVCLDGANEGARVRDLVAAKGVPWRTVYYPSGRNPIGEAYEVRALPWTLLIGRDGRVAAVGARGKDLAREVEEALSR